VTDSISKKIYKLLSTKRGLTAILTGPFFILFFLIVLFPFLLEMYLSYTPWHPRAGDWWTATFSGIENYIYLLTKDARFLLSLARTALFVVIVVSIEFGLGLLLAALFTTEFSGKRIAFGLLLLPMMMMPIIVGYDFYMIFQPNGPINHALSLISGKPIIINWFNEPILAWITLIITDVWHWTPFMFLVLLSGLVSLPPNIIDAAKVLGGTRWQIFKDIELPMLKNVIIIAIVIRAMEAMKLFDEIYIMTGGGPGTATETLSIYTYIFGAVNVRIGYTSAASIIILVLTIMIIGYAIRPILRALRG
jgi:multiple sugar transport system permease protein